MDLPHPRRYNLCYIANTTVPVAWCATVSARSSPIKFSMARLDVSWLVVTAVARRSTRPEVESNTLIISDPSALTEQVHESGWNPHSIMWRSSSVEIMTHVHRDRRMGSNLVIIATDIQCWGLKSHLSLMTAWVVYYPWRQVTTSQKRPLVPIDWTDLNL